MNHASANFVGPASFDNRGLRRTVAKANVAKARTALLISRAALGSTQSLRSSGVHFGLGDTEVAQSQGVAGRQ